MDYTSHLNILEKITYPYLNKISKEGHTIDLFL